MLKSTARLLGLRVLIVLPALLAACGTPAAGPTSYPTVTPRAVPSGPMKLVAGCELADLDDWSERAAYLAEAFGGVMLQAIDTPRTELEPLLSQMDAYKRSINDLIVPADCAKETHELLSALAAEVTGAFEAARADPAADVQSVVTRAQATLQLIRARIADLTTQMQATYDAADAGLQ
ncbi:MAG: hypothetical protein JXB47_12160 [Anaerolineae bacterium]|nr:hypothetical protein [Anaerolineae bacterium]